MKKYLYYIRKYYENFGFVNRVVWLTVKNYILIKITRDKILIEYIIKHNDKFNLNKLNKTNIEILKRTEKRIEKVFKLYPFRLKCLLVSLIKANYIRDKFNTYIKIQLGIKFKHDEMIAHAWLETDHSEKIYGFHKI